ncbi:MAG: type II secretion system F family protein [Methanosarcinaceae archaeon]|nr:type II secretion system F family protein [Methanosarcinaceae archaeon]MDD4749025.1 type II secretion system F family protein [Methanosarcinaceae archaeon]
MNVIDSYSFKVFGAFLLRHEEKFSHLKVTLRQAQISLPVLNFVSSSLFYSLLLGIFGGLGGLIAGSFLFRGITPEQIVSTFHISSQLTRRFDTPPLIAAHLPQLLTLLGGLGLFLLVASITWSLIMLYPSLKADNRRRAINQVMPHATAYLYVLYRGGGITIFEIIKSLSERPHLYGTTAREFGNIVRDIEYFGKDLQAALWDASDRTPSEQLRDFLDGLISIVSSGGDVTLYLKDKMELYKNNVNKEHKRFLETLALLAEVYITVFVVGPLFLMTVLVVMNLMDSGGGGISKLYILVYGVIPFGTLIFLILLDMLTGDAEKMPPEKFSLIKPDSFSDVRVKAPTEADLELIKQIDFFEKVAQIKKILLHPISAMVKTPKYAFFVSVPLALGYLVFAFKKESPFGFGFIEISSALDAHIYFSLLLLLIPFIIFHELEVRKIRKIEDQIPEFLKRLASINGTGILLADAITITAQSNMGPLKAELRRMVEDIRWNSNLVEALKRFESRIRTKLTRRSMTLIARASESTGNIHQVISIVAEDADVQKQLKKERNAGMFIYVFIIYVTFFVFLIIVYVLAAFFLPALSGTDNPAMSMGVNLEEYTLLFFHAALLQGLGSGMVAGKMGSGNLPSGLKHSLIMMSLAYLLFVGFL